MIGPAYFDYPHRGRRLDHDRFPMRYLRDAAPVAWPGGARVALWVGVHVEFHPLNFARTPFPPLAGLERPYPDQWHYATRDYGNRVGIYRLFEALGAAGVRASAMMNAEVATRYPALLADILTEGWEAAASGRHMGETLHAGLAPEREREIVLDSVDTLRRLSGRPVAGWHSPAHAQSARTPDLVAEAGATYLADWVNDDMPYRMRTAHGDLVQMPLTWALSDQLVLATQNQALADWESQVLAAFRCLADEADRTGGGRILSLSLTPWIMGQPYRIAALRRVLGEILAADEVWPATGEEIALAWAAASPA